MTRGQIATQIKAWLGLQTMGDYDESPLIDDMVYQGVLDVLSRTRCVARCVHLNTQANVDTYLLDHSILALVDVEDGATRRARRDQAGDDWPATIVYPAGYDPSCGSSTFTLIRSDVLRLSPAPSEDGSVDVWAVLRPQQMTDDANDLGTEAFGAIPDEYQDAVVLYALWKLSDYTDDASAQQGERYRFQYEGQDGRSGRLGQIRTLVNKRGTARAADRRVTLRRQRSRRSWVG